MTWKPQKFLLSSPEAMKILISNSKYYGKLLKFYLSQNSKFVLMRINYKVFLTVREISLKKIHKSHKKLGCGVVLCGTPQIFFTLIQHLIQPLGPTSYVTMPHPESKNAHQFCRATFESSNEAKK